ncbi:MAG: O-methyltransferase, partial [Thermoleophilaceae bacterium]|nr:O-methyltransferase [Thermoleophilaceae bacterium]
RREAAKFRALARIARVLAPRYVLTDPAKAWFDDDDFFRDFYAVESHDLTADRKYMLRQLLSLAGVVPGDTAECGVYLGASSWFICDHFRSSGRTHHGFDSFEGLPAPTALDGAYWHAGDLSTPENHARELLRAFDARLYRGWIPDRFDEVADRTFAFVHIDVDLYEPTRRSLEFFYPRVAAGGVILLDDHGFTSCPGATRAATEYMAARPEPIVQLTTGQAFIVKIAPRDESPTQGRR